MQLQIETDISTAVTYFSNSKSTKWQERHISVNPASTLGPLSTMMIELSSICFGFVFECGPARVTKQHSATISSSQPWWAAVD